MDLEFWWIGPVLVVDAVLVLAGGRGPRQMRKAAAVFLRVLLFGTIVALLLCVLIAGLSSDSGVGLMWGEMSLMCAVYFGLVGFVQWLSIRALEERA